MDLKKEKKKDFIIIYEKLLDSLFNRLFEEKKNPSIIGLTGKCPKKISWKLYHYCA